MLANTKNDNEKVVSARGRAPSILKCYLVFSAGYNFQEGGTRPLADTLLEMAALTIPL